MREHNRLVGGARSLYRSLHIMGRRSARRLGALVLVVVLLGAAPVLAATVDITIPLETVVWGPAGTQRVLAEVEVPVESRGETCRVTAVADNQDSEHPDSDLLISSDSSSVLILDVEGTAYGRVTSGGEIKLADSVKVTLTLGPDAVFSAGLDVEIDCPPFNPTTTTTAGSTADDTSNGSVSGDTTGSSQAGGTTGSVSGDTTDSSQAGGTTGSVSGDTTGSSEPEGAAGSLSGDTTGVSVLGTTITATAAGSSETLPLTGVLDESTGGVAIALVALGGLIVLSIRRRETEAIAAQEWSRRVDFYHINF